VDYFFFDAGISDIAAKIRLSYLARNGWRKAYETPMGGGRLMKLQWVEESL
jgi:hypothetical protein